MPDLHVCRYNLERLSAVKATVSRSSCTRAEDAAPWCRARALTNKHNIPEGGHHMHLNHNAFVHV